MQGWGGGGGRRGEQRESSPEVFGVISSGFGWREINEFPPLGLQWASGELIGRATSLILKSGWIRQERGGDFQLGCFPFSSSFIYLYFFLGGGFAPLGEATGGFRAPHAPVPRPHCIAAAGIFAAAADKIQAPVLIFSFRVHRGPAKKLIPPSF